MSKAREECATDSIAEDGVSNLNIAVGKDVMGENVFIDLSKYHFMLLTGSTGTGKSIFHNNLYKRLVENNSPEQIGFILLDMTQTDFHQWESPYIIESRATPNESIELLEKFAQAKSNENKHIFIHIEECDMFSMFTKRSERVVKSLLQNREHITLVYSTSRPSPFDALRPSLLSLTDVKVVFQLSTIRDFNYVLGGDATHMPKEWEKIVAFNSEKVLLQPYPESEMPSLQDFKLN